MDNDNRTVFVNPRMAEMLGYAESEMIGKNLIAFLDERNSEFAKHNLEGCKLVNQGNCEFEFVRKDGTRIFTSIAASQIKDDGGNHIGTLVLVADVTLRKQMETKLEEYSRHLEELVEQRTEQLTEAQAQLIKSERFAAIGELAGMVGHDLRNPLAGIRNAVYYLKKKQSSGTDTTGKEMLEVIDRAVEHANKIISDLLDYSREIHLELSECTPSSLLKEALTMIEVPSRIEVLDNTLNEPKIEVDMSKMERVFINLIKNAFDAMPGQGKLEIRSIRTNNNVGISFIDTGMGIPEQSMTKIFTPLFTTKAQGMGFGLPICKRIVEAHGGKITVESVAGKGTTFTLAVPIKPKLEDGGEKIWVIPQKSLLSTTTKAYESR